MTKTIVTACRACAIAIVLSEQQAILDFLGHPAGFLADYDYFCRSCLAVEIGLAARHA